MRLSMQATVSECEKLPPRFWEAVGEDGVPPETQYRVSYSYVLNGARYRDDFVANVVYSEGEHFPVEVEASNPKRNYALGQRTSMLKKILIWVLGLASAAAIIYLERRFGLESGD